MSLINGLLVLLVCQCAGEAIKAWLELSLPGPVLGMFILFIGLMLYQGIPEAIAKSSRTLIPMLGLMFLPAATGLFFLGSQYSNQWPAIIAAVVIGSLLSLIFNGLLMTLLARKRGSKS
ncbi:MAG: CidA/LrgA family protein [Oceanicoccus sp.]|uniref:CidA/LrgA family protein n=1 Tax=Oceanicoccus sp. TaxID=2691044 RepID=UPI00262A6357|nr:CidA/LrgA family protein [Oceanicoccus sp.]MCP3907396.1 CidA/LrgA family protein [Oceanicoccus sp.]